jgi:parallel beta helix pectate lyase-like protein
VIVREGRYPKLQLMNDTRRASMLTFRAKAGERVELAGVRTRDSAYLRVEGFKISDYVAVDYNSRDIEVVGNDITPHGVAVRTGSKRIVIERNSIHDISRDPAAYSPDGYGVWVSAGAGTIRDVTIRDNKIERVPVDAIQTAADGVTITGNDVSGVRRSLQGDHPDFVQILGGKDVAIVGNRLHDSPEEGIWVNNAARIAIENNVIYGIGGYKTQIANSAAPRIFNNTWSGPGYGDLLLRQGTDGAVVENNIVPWFGTTAPISFAKEDHNVVLRGARRGIHDVATAPRFVDSANGDFRLARGSVGIDAADSTAAPARDRQGQGRVDDPTVPNSGEGPADYWDIGAHEHVVD